MKKFFMKVLCFITGMLFIMVVPRVAVNGASQQINRSINQTSINQTRNYRVPLHFIANGGQVNEQAVFYARASNYTLWLTKKGMVFDCISKKSRDAQRDVYRQIFLNARSDGQIVAVDKPPLRVNFFTGKTKADWHYNVPATSAVRYNELYKRIDLKVYGSERKIEYDWIVKPGGNPGDIRFQFKNVRDSRIGPGGHLLIKTENGEFIHQKPVSFQVIDGKRVPVKSQFKALGKDTYGFKTGKYDPQHELVIDPLVLAYSTYLGGNGNDFAQAIAVDNSGNVYVTGHTYSTNYPVEDHYQNDQTDIDAFITRIDTNQSGVSSLIYSTYLGGSENDYGSGIAVNDSGIVYVCGTTLSADFPLRGELQGFQGSIDGFIARLDTNADGDSSLVYSTCLGGSSSENARAIAVDAAGLVYVAGNTYSSDFPLVNEYQSRQGSVDVFISKIDTNLGAAGLLYSSHLGSSGDEYGYGIAVDNSANVYIGGYTNPNARSFPTRNEYQADQPTRDVFVSRIDTTLSGDASLIYSTYLGGDDDEYGWGIAADNNGNAYVTGRTESTDYPTRNQYQSYPGDVFSNAFVTRIDTNSSGDSSLVYSTYLGGNTTDGAYAIALGTGGNVYVAGDTWSSDFPLRGYYQSAQGNVDAFIARLNTNLNGASSLIMSTRLGGSDHDYCRGIALDNNWGIYVTGYTPSSNFPMRNEFQTKKADSCSFVTKLTEHTLPTVTTAAVSPLNTTTASGGGTVVSGGDSPVTARGVCWSLSQNPSLLDNYTVDGSGVGTFSSSLTGLLPGTLYYVRAYATSAWGTAYGSEVSFTTHTNPTISGRVSDGNQPLENVTITFSHNGHSESTDAGGNYSYTAAWGIATVVRAAKTGYTFTPELYRFNSLKANKPNRDFKAFNDTPANPPHIELNRTRLNYGSITGGAQTGGQAVLIENSGGGSLAWTASVSDSWIKVSPQTGAEDSLLTISIDANGLAAGTYQGTVSITDANAGNSPDEVDIYLEVKEKASETPPMGNFDAPTHGSTVYSAVPVTGWALDDTEIQGVKIYRDPIPGHETDLIYIGDAMLVEGARPDKETAYSQYPKNYLAGWSYILLTNYLPGNGHGSFVITAKARDNSGNEVTLGSKTIICDNANAVNPFGTIDTPYQGGEVSGTAFLNFGWALTPLPNTIPTDGSTIKVYVDGVPLAGNPVYNLYRPDIALGFPGYNNSNGAVGYYMLDTTKYANGVHTISWSVSDDAGNSADIGSRYFRIMNVVNPSNSSAQSSTTVHVRNRSLLRRDKIPAPVKITAKEHLDTLEIKERRRIKVNVGKDYTGFLQVGKELRPLPPGSFLDTVRGMFYWQAGNGFIGKYRFLFIKRNHMGQLEKKELKVVIHPEF